MRFICSRQMECVMIIEAASMPDALAQLPTDPDDLAEQADGVAFASTWSVHNERLKGDPLSFDDDDVEEAKKSGLDEFMLKGGS